MSRRVFIVLLLHIMLVAGTKVSANELWTVPSFDSEGLDLVIVTKLRKATAEAKKNLAAVTPGDFTNRARILGQLGALFHAHRLYDPADHCYLQAVQSDPAELRWTYLHAVLTQEQGDVTLAIERLVAVLAAQPDYYPAVLRLAVLWRDKGDFDSAGRVMSRLPTGRSTPAWIQAAWGEHYMEVGKHQAAIGPLLGALERVPQASRLHFLLGQAYRHTGNLDKAEGHLNQAGTIGLTVQDSLLDEMRSLNESEVSLLAEGQRAFNAGAYDEAVVAYRRALEAQPDSVRARINLAAALAQAGQVSAAVRHLKIVLSRQPTNKTVLFNLARLKSETRQLAEAAELYRRLIFEAPSDGVAMIEYAKVELALGNFDSAVALAKEAAKQPSRFTQATLLQVKGLTGLEKYDKAIFVLETALEMVPADPALEITLANVLATSPKAIRDPIRALSLATGVYKQVPSSQSAESIALAYAALGRCAESVQWLKTVLSMNLPPGERGRVGGLLKGIEDTHSCGF